MLTFKTHPSRDVNPTVGFIPTKAFLSAGFITLPSVSVPSAKVTRFADTAAPLPELLPPGFVVKLYGDRHCPPLAE